MNLTDVLTAARQNARDAFRTARIHAPGGPDAALDAALGAYEATLIDRGVLPSGDADFDAETAAQRLGAASGHNLYTGDGWRALLTDKHRVWHAYHRALDARAADPDGSRFDLVRDRDILLSYEPAETPE